MRAKAFFINGKVVSIVLLANNKYLATIGNLNKIMKTKEEALKWLERHA